MVRHHARLTTAPDGTHGWRCTACAATRTGYVSETVAWRDAVDHCRRPTPQILWRRRRTNPAAPGTTTPAALELEHGQTGDPQ